MSDAPPPPKPPRKADPKVRRTPRGAPGSLSWSRGLQWHVVLGDRRQSGSAGRPPGLQEVNEGLRARLMAQDVGRAARVMRHLVFANDELRRKGWRGVEALPAPVLRRALAQAQMLASDEAWPVLARIVERLHLMHVGAQLREQRKAKLRANGKTRVEVTELTHDELEETASAAGWEACHRPPYRRGASPVLVRPGECGRRHAPNRVPADRKPGGGTAAPAATKA